MDIVKDPAKNHIGRQFFYAIQNQKYQDAADYLTEMVRRQNVVYPENDLVLQVFMSAHIVSAFDLAGILPIEKLEPLERILATEIQRFRTEYRDYSDPVSLMVHHIMQKVSALCGLESPLASDRMASIKNYIDTFYSSPELTASDLGLRFDLSLPHLSRTFKQVVGQNLSEYIHEVRIRNAQRLLIETDLPVNEIALAVGYTTGNAFIRAYRNVEGISPGAYRNRMRNLVKNQE